MGLFTKESKYGKVYHPNPFNKKDDPTRYMDGEEIRRRANESAERAMHGGSTLVPGQVASILPPPESWVKEQEAKKQKEQEAMDAASEQCILAGWNKLLKQDPMSDPFHILDVIPQSPKRIPSKDSLISIDGKPWQNHSIILSGKKFTMGNIRMKLDTGLVFRDFSWNGFSDDSSRFQFTRDEASVTHEDFNRDLLTDNELNDLVVPSMKNRRRRSAHVSAEIVDSEELRRRFPDFIDSDYISASTIGEFNFPELGVRPARAGELMIMVERPLNPSKEFKTHVYLSYCITDILGHYSDIPVSAIDETDDGYRDGFESAVRAVGNDSRDYYPNSDPEYERIGENLRDRHIIPLREFMDRNTPVPSNHDIHRVRKIVDITDQLSQEQADQYWKKICRYGELRAEYDNKRNFMIKAIKDANPEYPLSPCRTAAMHFSDLDYYNHTETCRFLSTQTALMIASRTFSADFIIRETENAARWKTNLLFRSFVDYNLEEKKAWLTLGAFHFNKSKENCKTATDAQEFCISSTFINRMNSVKERKIPLAECFRELDGYSNTMLDKPAIDRLMSRQAFYGNKDYDSVCIQLIPLENKLKAEETARNERRAAEQAAMEAIVNDEGDGFDLDGFLPEKDSYDRAIC
jgi:hypothetical protein